MKRFISLLIHVFIILSFSSWSFGQSAPSTPPIRNYQDYLVMMRAMNDFARQKGMETEKPLSKKEWEKLYPTGGPDAPAKQNPTGKKVNE